VDFGVEQMSFLTDGVEAGYEAVLTRGWIGLGIAKYCESPRKTVSARNLSSRKQILLSRRTKSNSTRPAKASTREGDVASCTLVTTCGGSFWTTTSLLLPELPLHRVRNNLHLGSLRGSWLFVSY